MATWHQEKMPKILEIQGFEKCRTAFVMKGSCVQVALPAPKHSDFFRVFFLLKQIIIDLIRHMC